MKDPLILDAVAAYDAIAPAYQSIYQFRLPYLNSVDSIVVAHAAGAHSLLDVGAGDGRRALRLAKSIGSAKVVLVEPSTGMRRNCDPNLKVFPCKASEIPPTTLRFDVITCLWNVLGHMRDDCERGASLVRLRSLLSDSGTIFIDIQHRYNAAVYGWAPTLLRMANDSLRLPGRRGDVVVRWKTGHKKISTMGHVFTQTELHRLFREAALTVMDRWIIDYTTGALRKYAVHGNLLYQLRASS